MVKQTREKRAVSRPVRLKQENPTTTANQRSAIMDTTEHAMRVASAAGTNIQQPEKTREANNFNKPKKKEKKKA